MSDPEHHGPGVGELSRQVRDVLGRFEQLLNKLEAAYVNKDFFKLYTDSVARELLHLTTAQGEIQRNADKGVEHLEALEKVRNAELEKRIAKLENNITWIVRIVIAAVVIAVLAAIGISRSSGGA